MSLCSLLKALLGWVFVGAISAHAALSSAQIGWFESFLYNGDKIVGKIEIHTTSQGKLTGELITKGRSSPLAGTLKEDASGTASWRAELASPSKAPIKIAVAIASDGVFSSVARMALNDDFIGSGGSERLMRVPSSKAKALARDYTIAWSFNDSYGAKYRGHAHATASIDPTGRLEMSGRTPDGVAFKTSAQVDSTLTARIYAHPHKQSATFFHGELKFTRRSDGQYHVVDAVPGSFAWAGPINLKKKTVYQLSTWMEPWTYSTRPAFWKSLKWKSEPLIAIRIGLESDSSFLDQYYAIPETLKLNDAMGFIPKDYYAYYSINSNKWDVRLDSRTGLFTGTYLTYGTLHGGGTVEIVNTFKNKVRGVMILPDPSDARKGRGFGTAWSNDYSPYADGSIDDEPVQLTQK